MATLKISPFDYITYPTVEKLGEERYNQFREVLYTTGVIPNTRFGQYQYIKPDNVVVVLKRFGLIIMDSENHTTEGKELKYDAIVSALNI